MLERGRARTAGEHRLFPDGFAGQRLVVLPRPIVEELAGTALFNRLLVTDAGYFSRAGRHGRARHVGVEQVIVIFCVDGAGWCRIDGTFTEVLAGQVLIIPPGTVHSYGADPANPWTIWWFHCSGSDVADLIEACGATPDRPIINPQDLMRLTELVNELLSLMERDSSPINLTGASGAAWHFFSLLNRKRGSVVNHRDPIEQALIILRRNTVERIAVTELAKEVGLSTTYFSSLFHKTVGCGVVEYQRRQRMSEARTLLDSTQLTIAQVSKRVGYDDPFYFSRQFRQTHGIAPRDYRASAKG